MSFYLHTHLYNCALKPRKAEQEHLQNKDNYRRVAIQASPKVHRVLRKTSLTMHSVETTEERIFRSRANKCYSRPEELTSKSQQNPNDPQLTSLTGKKKSSTLTKALQ